MQQYISRINKINKIEIDNILINITIIGKQLIYIFF